ncbi:MAG: hypothetical protein DHS20C14_22940 [Phycisphaeraceae bacterium]|nr:MAG: hypothetical protein DHS20C14_22940 [Phycisphaeraceae bacterium]
MVALIWWDWWPDHSINPWRQTLSALLTCMVAGVFAYLGFRKAKPWMMGMRGERAVSEVLHEISSWGYRVFHDMHFERDGKTWNIDHVMVGPSGVYAIETKLWVNTGGKGKPIHSAGPVAQSAVAQAKRNAQDIEKLLRNRTGLDMRVRAVVLLPNRMVEESPGQAVWVLNPKRFFTWVRNEERSNSPTGAPQIRQIADALDTASRGTVSL